MLPLLFLRGAHRPWPRACLHAQVRRVSLRCRAGRPPSEARPLSSRPPLRVSRRPPPAVAAPLRPPKKHSPHRPVRQRLQATRLQSVHQGGCLVRVLEELDDGVAGHGGKGGRTEGTTTQSRGALAAWRVCVRVKREPASVQCRWSRRARSVPLRPMVFGRVARGCSRAREKERVKLHRGREGERAHAALAHFSFVCAPLSCRTPRAGPSHDQPSSPAGSTTTPTFSLTGA